jgi:alpha-1,3-glucosyltransferase
MYPLLKRDGVGIPYFVLTALWAWLMGVPSMTLFSTNGKLETMKERLLRFLHLSFYALMVFWHILEAFLQPPQSKPDLWVVVNVLVGAAGFALCYIWCLWRLWATVSQGLSRNNVLGDGQVKAKTL